MSVVHVWDLGLLCRFFYTKGGETYAAARMINYAKRIGEGAEHVLMCRDPDNRHTFRNDLFPEYKAHRVKDPEEQASLVAQYVEADKLCRVNRIPVVGAEGFEADDVVATVATSAEEAGFQVVVFSHDKDMAQLMSPDITLHNGKEVVTAAMIRERFGVDPSQVVDYLAIAGDTADGVPGVPGLGPKAAQEILATYGSLERAIGAVLADAYQKPAWRRKLRDNADMARLCRRLIVLARNAPVGGLPWEA